MKKTASFFAILLLASLILTVTVPIKAYAIATDETEIRQDFTAELDDNFIVPYANNPHMDAGNGGFERVFKQYGNSKNADTIRKAFNNLAAGAIGIGIATYAPAGRQKILNLAATTLVPLFSKNRTTEYYTVTTYVYYGKGSVADRSRVVVEVYRDSARTQLKARRSNFLSLK